MAHKMIGCIKVYGLNNDPRAHLEIVWDRNDLVVISRNVWGIQKGVGVYLELSSYGGRVYFGI